jgi:diguanylate cyclase (GGDEF)-like protein
MDCEFIMTITLKSRLGLGRDVSISAPLSSDDLAKQELTDQVTGLLNRYGLAYGLTRHTDKPIGVVFTDIGGFKNINDRYGHHVGDEVLAESAKRIDAATPPEYVVGRFAGDQFAVFLPGVEDISVTQTAAVALLRACDPLVIIGESVLGVYLSIGVAISPPRDLLNGMRAADAAMYEAKNRGRARAVCLNPEWEAH